MFGLIGKFSAVEGQRDALLEILAALEPMPGCLSYIVARDTQDESGIWITEVWDSTASHAASLQMPAVRDAITRATM
jgi:quinol monooxygenase YgiN